MPNYQFREANEEQRAQMERIRDTFEWLEAVIRQNSTISSREQTLAITNLEQAAMWAIKAVHA